MEREEDKSDVVAGCCRLDHTAVVLTENAALSTQVGSGVSSASHVVLLTLFVRCLVQL